MDLISLIYYLPDRLIILIISSKIYHRNIHLSVESIMQKNCLFKNIVIFIVLCLIFRGSSGAYCSAYCSYYNLGAAYSPMCTD